MTVLVSRMFVVCAAAAARTTGGGNCEVLAVVLPHAKNVKTGFVGNPCPFEDVAHTRCGVHRLTLGVAGQLTKGEDADLERVGGTHAPTDTSAPS